MSRYLPKPIESIVVAIPLIALGLCCTESRAQLIEPVNSVSADNTEIHIVAGVVPMTAGSNGVTELMMAISNEDVDNVHSLIETGAVVDAADQYDRSALSWAVSVGNVQIVQMLLEAGAQPNRIALDGNSPISLAVRSGSDEISQLLLEYGADPNTVIVSSASFRPPVTTSMLELAAQRGRVNTVEALIAAGVDVETTGATAIGTAVSKGNREIVVALMRVGVDPTTSTENKCSSALGAAAEGGYLDIAKLLLAAGSDPNCENHDGQTPLLLAVNNNHAQTVKLLLENGAVTTAHQLSRAVRQNNDEIIDALVTRINIDNIPEAEKIALLRLAEATNRQQVIAALLPIDKTAVDPEQRKKFLYVQDNDSDTACDVMLWDPRHDSVRNVHSVLTSCMGRLSVAENDGNLFVIDSSEIRVVSIENDVDIEIVDLPKNLLNETSQRLAQLFREHFGEGYDQYANISPNLAGNLATGELAFVASAGGPADGTYSYLFTYNDEAWRLVDERTCHRFETDCRFDRIESRRLMDWPQERAVWHPYIRKNAFFVEKSSAVIVNPERPMSRERIVFDFGGQISTLTYVVAEGGHCAGDCTYSQGLSLEGAMGIKELASCCRSSIIDRFALVQRIRANVELFDMATGESLFGPLAMGTWIN